MTSAWSEKCLADTNHVVASCYHWKVNLKTGLHTCRQVLDSSGFCRVTVGSHDLQGLLHRFYCPHSACWNHSPPCVKATCPYQTSGWLFQSSERSPSWGLVSRFWGQHSYQVWASDCIFVAVLTEASTTEAYCWIWCSWGSSLYR